MPANRLNASLLPVDSTAIAGAGTRRANRQTATSHPSAGSLPSLTDPRRHRSGFPLVPGEKMGDSLLSLSYGNGKVYTVLQHQTGTTVQGALTELGVELPTGVMRGRFHPISGDLYLVGLFGWSSEKQEDTGFYRIRMTGAPFRTPKSFRAVSGGLVINFYAPLAPESAQNPENWRVQSWEYRWTENYGSPQLKRSGEEGRDTHLVQSATLSADGKNRFPSKFQA